MSSQTKQYPVKHQRKHQILQFKSCHWLVLSFSNQLLINFLSVYLSSPVLQVTLRLDIMCPTFYSCPVTDEPTQGCYLQRERDYEVSPSSTNLWTEGALYCRAVPLTQCCNRAKHCFSYCSYAARIINQ